MPPCTRWRGTSNEEVGADVEGLAVRRRIVALEGLPKNFDLGARKVATKELKRTTKEEHAQNL